MYASHSETRLENGAKSLAMLIYCENIYQQIFLSIRNNEDCHPDCVTTATAITFNNLKFWRT